MEVGVVLISCKLYHLHLVYFLPRLGKPSLLPPGWAWPLETRCVVRRGFILSGSRASYYGARRRATPDGRVFHHLSSRSTEKAIMYMIRDATTNPCCRKFLRVQIPRPTLRKAIFQSPPGKPKIQRKTIVPPQLSFATLKPKQNEHFCHPIRIHTTPSFYSAVMFSPFQCVPQTYDQ